MNYSVLLGEMGNPEQGLESLQKCAIIVKKYNSDKCLDYAIIQETIACLYLGMGQIKLCEKHFDLALSIYQRFYADEPEFIEAKKAEITNYFALTGVGGKGSIKKGINIWLIIKIYK